MARRGELLQQLTSAGLSSEQNERYFSTLRSFLNAGMTKLEYEDSMSKILPKDKIRVHNNIIIDLLRRAHLKRENAPNLPILREKKQVKTRGKGVKKEGPKAGIKRKRSGIFAHPHPLDPARNARGNKLVLDIDSSSVATADADSISILSPTASGAAARRAGPNASRPRKRIRRGSSAIPSPSASKIASPLKVGTSPAVGQADRPIPYFPIVPGTALDAKLFASLKSRLEQLCADNDVKEVSDDAVAVLVHAVEERALSLIEGLMNQRPVTFEARPPKAEVSLISLIDENKSLVTRKPFQNRISAELERSLLL